MTKPVEKNLASVVYVVDDDDGMRRALGTLLSTVGYKTAVFSRPSEFLAAFKPDSPGCLVLDIRMPDMSGLEVQQHLNRMGSMLPIIFINENNRQHGTHTIEMLLNFQPAHVRHAYIQYQAPRRVGFEGCQEFTRARKNGRFVADGA